MYAHGISGEAKVIYTMNQYSLKNQGLARKWTKTKNLVLNQCVAKCRSGYNTLQNFGLYLNLGAYNGSYDWPFLSHLLVSWWSQVPLFDLKSHSRFYLYTICVIFGPGDYRLLSKGKFVLLQGEIFVRMGCPHHIDMFCTHLMHSFTSFKFILSNSIIETAHVIKLPQRLLQKEKYVFICYGWSMLYH